MCLKSVKNYLFNKGTIRTRLALLYTLAAFFPLIILTMFLYWEMCNILYQANYQFLSDEVDTIQFILNNQNSNQRALKKVTIDMPMNTDRSIYRYFVRIVDENDNVLIQTPGSDEVLKNTTKPNIALLSKKRYWRYSNQGVHYLLIKAPINFKKDNKTGAILIALDVSHQHIMMNDRKVFIFSSLAVTFFSLLLGWFISRKGMESLYVLTKTTKRITAGSLNQRIDPHSWPNELRELGVAFNQMLDRIQAAFLRLKQFSADLAHELRTPINNLIGETEIALSYSRSVQEYQNVLGSNLEELHRISQLMENILFLARAENPELIIDKKLLNINDEIKVICEFYQAMAEEKNIKISCEGEGKVYANSVMFRRMLSNILSNSLKYTSANGWIRLMIKKEDPVKVIISDNGMGIAAEHLPKIFDRFYRVDSARSQLSGGIGLGLAIVKSIVELHGGTIAIASELGQGTTMTIALP